MKYHITKKGNKIPISKMDDLHLINTIKYLKKLAEKGIVIRSGGGSTPEDFWYEERIIKGEEALKALNFAEYLCEAKKRKILRRQT